MTLMGERGGGGRDVWIGNGEELVTVCLSLYSTIIYIPLTFLHPSFFSCLLIQIFLFIFSFQFLVFFLSFVQVLCSDLQNVQKSIFPYILPINFRTSDLINGLFTKAFSWIVFFPNWPVLQISFRFVIIITDFYRLLTFSFKIITDYYRLLTFSFKIITDYYRLLTFSFGCLSFHPVIFFSIN